MADSLFRQDALDKLSTPDDLDRTLEASASWHWVAMGACAVILVGGLLWSCVVKVPIFVEGFGVLMGASDAMEYNISAPVDGRIAQLAVKPGQAVRLGDIIGTMDIEDLNKQIEYTQARQGDLRDQYDAILRFQDSANKKSSDVEEKRMMELEERLSSLDKRLERLQAQGNRKRGLADKGFLPRTEVEELQTQIELTNDEIYASQRSITEIALSQIQRRVQNERERLDLELQIKEVSRELQLLETQARKKGVIRSDYPGIVSEIKVDNGQFVTRDDIVISLIPIFGKTGDDPIDALTQAVVFIDVREGKKIRDKMAVKLLPTIFEEEDYGQLVGTVREVSRISLSDDGLYRLLKNQRLINTLVEREAPFKVTVDLEANSQNPTALQWTASKGPETSLDFGTVVNSKIVVERVRLIELAIPALKRLFPAEAGQDNGADELAREVL